MDVIVETDAGRSEAEVFADMVQTSNYPMVVRMIQGGEDVNQCLNFRFMRITSLEHSVFHNDWRMAAIFFVYGADLSNNKLAGVLQMFDFSAGYENPVVHKYLEGKVNHNFGGLRVLSDEDDEFSGAFLWLIEICHRGRIDLTSEYAHFLYCMEVVGEDWFSRDLSKKELMQYILCLRRCGLPNILVKKIVEDLVLNFIWMFLVEIAHKGDI